MTKEQQFIIEVIEKIDKVLQILDNERVVTFFEHYRHFDIVIREEDKFVSYCITHERCKNEDVNKIVSFIVCQYLVYPPKTN